MALLDVLDNRRSHIRRYNRIVAVLTKYGFQDLVAHIGTKKHFPMLSKLVPHKTYEHAIHHTQWEKMRMVCEELGPTFIKFGQILSNRPDLLPAPLIAELEKLQDHIAPSRQDITAVIEKELGRKPDEIFERIDPAPLASASIAQVHRATLKSGEEVVIKIQRPDIRETVEADIKIMHQIVGMLVKRKPSIKSFDPEGLINHFEQSIKKEMDFIHEAINLQRFNNHFRTDKHDDGFVYSPKVYKQYTTRKILTLEYIEGIKVSRLDELEKNGLDKHIIARRLLDAWLKQVFKYGFFHADPHPGNILIMPDNVICFIDYGMMGSILHKDIVQLGNMLLAIKAKDVGRIIRSFRQLSDDVVIRNQRALESDLDEFVKSYAIREMHQNEMSAMIVELKEVIIRHQLKVPTYFYLFAKSLVSLEGVIKQLDPDLHIARAARPYMAKIIAKRYNPLKFGVRLANTLYESSSYLEEFPRDIRSAIRKINAGEVKVELQHEGIDPLVHTLNRISKQVVAAMTISALIIGSALIIVAGIPPRWNNVPVLGVIGLVLAALIGLGLLRNIRKGDHDN
ncbi:MAG: AarF/ABC1/UbiB kinase family protein [Flavobacteriales bacterium]|nr:AarF/ABC1/UbiB kinase family protein [Flavobacteriales bacterium]MCB9448719.1 AarF/ABC1/UbiB kinase family protein [Flavobacteriales bacterium]